MMGKNEPIRGLGGFNQAFAATEGNKNNRTSSMAPSTAGMQSMAALTKIEEEKKGGNT